MQKEMLTFSILNSNNNNNQYFFELRKIWQIGGKKERIYVLNEQHIKYIILVLLFGVMLVGWSTVKDWEPLIHLLCFCSFQEFFFQSFFIGGGRGVLPSYPLARVLPSLPLNLNNWYFLFSSSMFILPDNQPYKSLGGYRYRIVSYLA